MAYKISIVIEKDKNGFYAYAPELKGCHTQGDSLDEVMANMKEAAELYLETLSPDERAELATQEILTGSVEVQVA
jgi:predicted RNase H-like HicB family nuclease